MKCRGGGEEREGQERGEDGMERRREMREKEGNEGDRVKRGMERAMGVGWWRIIPSSCS